MHRVSPDRELIFVAGPHAREQDLRMLEIAHLSLLYLPSLSPLYLGLARRDKWTDAILCAAANTCDHLSLPTFELVLLIGFFIYQHELQLSLNQYLVDVFAG